MRMIRGVVFVLLFGVLSVQAEGLWTEVATYRLGEPSARVEEAFRRVNEAFGEEAQREMETALLGALQHADATTDGKTMIMRMLLQVGSERSVAPLAALLHDEPLATFALRALEQIGGPAAATALREALQHASESVVKAGLIGSLAALGDQESIPAIAALASESDLAPAALRALGSMGGAEAMAALADLDVPAHLLVAHRQAMTEAARTLPEQEALPVFRRFAQDDDARVAWPALAALTDAVPAEGADLIVAALAGEDVAHQRAVLSLLAEGFGGSKLLQHLSSHLDAMPLSMQSHILVALGQRRDRAALPFVLASITAEDDDVRGAAIAAAARLGGGEAVVALLASDDRRVVDALARMEGDTVHACLIEELSEPAHRARAADLLARRRVQSAVPAMLEILAADEPEGRREIWNALGTLTGEADANRFVPLVFQEEGGEQRAALGALRNLVMRTAPGEIVFNEIMPHFATSPEGTQHFILDIAAVVATPEALRLVEEALEEEALRGRAIRALIAWRTGDSVARLLHIAASDAFEARDRLSALRGSLQNISKPGIDEAQRIAYLLDAASLISRPEEKRMLLAALRDARDPRFAPVVGAWLDSDEVRDEAELAAWNLVWHLRTNEAASLRELAAKMAQSPNEETTERAQKVQDFWNGN